MRLIDADALRKFLHEDDFDTPDERWKPESEFAKMIDALPTIDIKTEVAREIFAEIENHIRPFESAEDMHGRQAFENGDTTAMQIHQYAENLLGHFSDYIAELKNKYIGGVGE